MGGRADYEERKQKRIDRYKALSEKAKEESEARYNSTANRILMMTPGQPIIVGHHSEKKARRLHKKANNDLNNNQVVRINDIREALYDTNLDTEYREAMAHALMILRYVSDSPLNLSFGTPKQQEEIREVEERPLDNNHNHV